MNHKVGVLQCSMMSATKYEGELQAIAQSRWTTHPMACQRCLLSSTVHCYCLDSNISSKSMKPPAAHNLRAHYWIAVWLMGLLLKIQTGVRETRRFARRFVQQIRDRAAHCSEWLFRYVAFILYISILCFYCPTLMGLCIYLYCLWGKCARLEL